jgi:hypothetical protein
MLTTRRAVVQFALVLQLTCLVPPAVPAPASAQNSTVGSSASLISTTFADFEGGTWAGWTVTGDAFGAAPGTNVLFSGEIRGFGGLGFVCTLNPRSGNAAMGKAVSPEFTIERPLITFRGW